MTKQELMESSPETLALWAAWIQEEMGRRHLNLEFDDPTPALVVSLHAGNIVKGEPAPLLVRVLKKVTALPPSALAKIEMLADGFGRSVPP